MTNGTHARRSIDAARSSLKLAAFLGVVGALLLVMRWPGGRIAFGLAAFFLVVSALEFLNARRLRSSRSHATRPKTTEPPRVEFAAYLLRDEHAYGASMPLAGRNVPLDLAEDELLETRKQVAREPIARSEELTANFDAFRNVEAARNPRYADVIRGLEIEWISFHDTDPRLGEVYFTAESGEEAWFAGLRGLEFFGLTMES